jgi:hypothetical protein
MPVRPDEDATYALAVRQAGILLTTAFRSRVAPGAPAIGEIGVVAAAPRRRPSVAQWRTAGDQRANFAGKVGLRSGLARLRLQQATTPSSLPR